MERLQILVVHRIDDVVRMLSQFIRRFVSARPAGAEDVAVVALIREIGEFENPFFPSHDVGRAHVKRMGTMPPGAASGSAENTPPNPWPWADGRRLRGLERRESEGLTCGLHCAPCPFREEKTPSFKVKNGGYHRFGRDVNEDWAATLVPQAFSGRLLTLLHHFDHICLRVCIMNLFPLWRR